MFSQLSSCKFAYLHICTYYIFIGRELKRKWGSEEPNQETFSRCVLDGDLECQIGGNYWGQSKSITQSFMLYVTPQNLGLIQKVFVCGRGNV